MTEFLRERIDFNLEGCLSVQNWTESGSHSVMFCMVDVPVLP
jgi:hypothetical protein